MEADTAAFFPESVSRWPSNWVQQLNTAEIDQAHEADNRELGEVSVESEILIDTENALSATSGDIESYSPLSESRFDSCDSFGRQDRDSVAMTDSGSIPIGLYRASVATDGSRSIRIGLETEPRFPKPTHLSLRSGPQDLQDRPLDVKISPGKSKTILRFKDTEKIIALAVSPTGDQAAFLFSHKCRVYAISANTAIEKISIELERKVNWTRLCIGSEYLVVYGTERGPTFRGPTFQNRVSRSLWIEPSSMRLVDSNESRSSCLTFALAVLFGSSAMRFMESRSQMSLYPVKAWPPAPTSIISSYMTWRQSPLCITYSVLYLTLRQEERGQSSRPGRGADHQESRFQC